MTKDSFVSPKHSRPWSQSGSTPDVGLATSSLQALHSYVPGLSVRSGKVMTGLALKEEESPPIRLAKLNRSPQSILTNRMRFVTMQANRSQGRPEKDDEEVETGNIEQEIAGRLDHIEKEKSVKKEKLLAMKDRLLEDYRVAVEAVREARERIKLQQTQLVFHQKSLQCLLALKAEEERIHEEALQKIQDLKPRLVYRPPELARSQGSVFSCLTSLSGQLTELCWGRAGAGLVVERLELGTDQAGVTVTVFSSLILGPFLVMSRLGTTSDPCY